MIYILKLNLTSNQYQIPSTVCILLQAGGVACMLHICKKIPPGTMHMLFWEQLLSRIQFVGLNSNASWFYEFFFILPGSSFKK